MTRMIIIKLTILLIMTVVIIIPIMMKITTSEKFILYLNLTLKIGQCVTYMQACKKRLTEHS